MASNDASIAALRNDQAEISSGHQSSPSSTTAISRIARACHSAFQDIRVVEDQSATVITRIPRLFPESSSSPQTKASFSLEDLDDEFEQFRVWARNLGVFAPNNGSLDFRLREAPDVKAGIVALLQGLQSNLVECLFLLGNDRNFDPNIQLSSPTSSDSESDDSYSESSAGADPTALELQGRLRLIRESINKLVKLAGVIRASGVRNRTLRAANYVHWENGVNHTEIFETQFLPQVLKFRFQMKEPLLSRLCKAISLRRRRFMYQQKHEKSLAYGLPGLDTISPDPRNRGADTLHMDSRQGSLPRRILTSGPGSVQQGSDLRPPTTATTFVQVGAQKRSPSSIVSGSSRQIVGDIEIPPAPDLLKGGSHFQCPYCRLLIEEDHRRFKSRRSLREWRKHLISDLQPFICIEPECSNPDAIFESREDWIAHQEWEHAIEWWCEGGDHSHPPTRFVAEKDFCNHFERYHVEDVKAHGMTRLLKIFGRPSPQPFGCCPFCDFLPDGANLSKDNVLGDGVVGATAQEVLQSHIARELLLRFLLALPEREDLTAADSDTNRPRGDRSTILDLLDIPLIFQTQDDAMTTLELWKDDDDPWRLPVPPLRVGIWEEIWAELDQKHIRNTYDGHEKDGVLKNFIDAQREEEDPSPWVIPCITILTPEGEIITTFDPYVYSPLDAAEGSSTLLVDGPKWS